MRIEVEDGRGIIDPMMAFHRSSHSTAVSRCRHLSLVLVLASAPLWAADPTSTTPVTPAVASPAGPPPVPDPLGLGERLALIDYLQTTYHIHPAAGETLEELEQRHVAAWTAAHAPDPVDVADQRERVRRLRQHISDHFHQEPDASLDEAGLVDLLHRLEDDQKTRDQAALSSHAVADTGRAPAPGPVAPSAPPAAHGGPGTTKPHPASAPAAGPQATAKAIPFSAEGVADCRFWNDGSHSLLLVCFGTDPTGAFRGLPENTWNTFRQSKEVHRAVALFGHGNGTGIGFQSIEANLKQYKDFYESSGGQMPAQPIECLLFASCSEQNADQMSEMRDGLGYYPIWKVAAGSRNYMNGPVFIAALQAVIEMPASTNFRGFFRFGATGDTVSSIGEVGENGARGDLTYWRVVQSATGFSTVKQP
jgi:hypothetical protein